MLIPDTAVVSRFAPSPSGPLHFGSLLAALASFLEARTRGGRWLLRIEDVDTPRVVAGATARIVDTLRAYGLIWDGELCYQSQRQEAYQQALAQLQADGWLYPCTCSRRKLAQHARMGASGWIYPGWCRTGVCQPEHPAALRVRTQSQPIRFTDRLQGKQSQQLEAEVGDFVLQRADGIIAYQLAVVVDDAEQGINQVVRGSDLLDSTPRQIYLQQLLQQPTPEYLHIPVVVDAQGMKLSKHTGALALDDACPGPALTASLRFLGQQPPAELANAPAATIIDWALAHWRSERIPTGLTGNAPDARS